MLSPEEIRGVVDKIRHNASLPFHLWYSENWGVCIRLNTAISIDKLSSISDPVELAELIETEIAIFRMMQ